MDDSQLCGARMRCCFCKLYFHRFAFNAHRIRDKSGKRCLTPDEMRTRGWHLKMDIWLKGGRR